MYVYPYGDSQQLNLDWIINKLKELEDQETSAADLEEIANVFIALTHSSGTQYRRYDYCYYQGKLYRALNDNIGPFNASDWMEVRLGDDIPIITRLINAIDASAVFDVKFDTSGTNGKLQQKYNNAYHDVVEVDYTPVQNSKRPLSSNAGYDLKGAINDIEHQITNFIETEDTASQTYYKGAYLIWKGGLYRVIANVINQGDAFVVDTNIKSLTLESVLVTLTVPIAVSDEASLKRTSFNFFASAPIPLGSTGVTLETYAYGTVISSDGDSGMLFASGYNGNLYVAFLAGGVFVRAQIYDNRGTSITLTPDQTYVSSTTEINCKRTGNLVTFSGTIILGANAVTDNILLSGFPAPTSDVDILGTVIEATDSTQRGKAGRYRIKTNGTLVPWYNTWGANEQGTIITFNTSYII